MKIRFIISFDTECQATSFFFFFFLRKNKKSIQHLLCGNFDISILRVLLDKKDLRCTVQGCTEVVLHNL